MTFSKTCYETQRKAIRELNEEPGESLNEAMGDSYYEPQIYIAKCDMNNDGAEELIVYIMHIGWTGSAGSSLEIMYYDGEKITKSQYISHFRFDESNIEQPGNEQVGIISSSPYNELYILGKVWSFGSDGNIKMP